MLQPSDLHACLTNGRIDQIGHLIARVRAENLDSSDIRDDSWSLGCRAYRWVCSEIAMAAEEESWLSVVDPSLRFIAKIGDIEFSFYKGLVDKPKVNIFSRAQTHPELRQNVLGLEMPIPERIVWTFAVETDLEGTTTNIEFIGMSDSGEVVASRRIPLLDELATITRVGTSDDDPTNLAAAPVSLPKKRHTDKIAEDKSRK